MRLIIARSNLRGNGPVDLVKVAERLTAKGYTVATAESCTGGLVAKLLTDIPGSSAYFIEGLVAYANQAKTRLLGVPEHVLAQHGAVSEAVAIAMAMGCRIRSGADYTIAVTGIAGPGGGTPDKPVGLVFVAIADRSGCVAHKLELGADSSREQIRAQAARFALEELGHRIAAT